MRRRLGTQSTTIKNDVPLPTDPLALDPLSGRCSRLETRGVPGWRWGPPAGLQACPSRRINAPMVNGPLVAWLHG
jgi:hypothetical protein